MTEKPRWEPKTVEDYKAMLQAKSFLFERQRDTLLRVMMENAVFRRLIGKLIDIFELDE